MKSAIFGAALLLAGAVHAAEPVDLTWEQLASLEGAEQQLRGMVQHGAAPQALSSDPTRVRNDWDGQTVRLSGFTVPIEYSGTGITALILVPYVGACIHVPPPPPNQLVMVTTETPWESEGLFEAVTVTGMFGAATTDTQLAEIGYALSADKIEPYSE